MKFIIPTVAGVALAALLGLACQIKPVVTVPEERSDRYSDCRRVSKAYCREVVGAEDEELSRCVAKATYDCVSGRAPRRD